MNINSKKAELKINKILYRTFPAETHKEAHREADGLVLYIKGGHLFDFCGSEIVAREGMMFYIPYGSAYRNRVLFDNTEYYQIDFVCFDNGNPTALLDSPRVFDIQDALKYQSLFFEAYKIYSEKESAYNVLCLSVLLKMIAMLFQNHENESKAKAGVTRIERTLARIKEFYYLNDSVEELASFSYMSVSSLEKIFKNHFGMSPLAYRRNIRIDNARLFLLEGYSIKETAEKVGYNDEYYFSKIFKKTCGVSPGTYVKLNSGL